MGPPKPPKITLRSPLVKRFDEVLTRALGLLGRAWGRPDEDQLQAFTGRARGGPGSSGGPAFAVALEAGRRAMETGRLGEALHHFGQAVAARPEDPWGWHGRGDAFQLGGQHEAALEAYDRAIQALELALSHNGRGNALEGLGRLEEAQAAWERALELDPRLSWPRRSLERTRSAKSG